jgi:probable FeS assembly SUF system protein SufT
MYGYGNDPVALTRDCDALLIPSGDPIHLEEGTVVYLTQGLGGSYTVYVDGNLARIAGRDADALGLEPPPEPTVAAQTTSAGDDALDEALIWEQLRTCYDPEIPINIVDLGLIYDCQIIPLAIGGHQVDIKMTLTAPGCGMGVVLVEDIKEKLAHVPGVSEVDVALVFDPPWSYERMSEAARLETGML